MVVIELIEISRREGKGWSLKNGEKGPGGQHYSWQTERSAWASPVLRPFMGPHALQKERHVTWTW